MHKSSLRLLTVWVKTSLTYISRRGRIGRDASIDWALGIMNEGNVIADFDSDLIGNGSHANLKVIGLSSGRQVQGIDTRVTSLDGVQLIEVWDDARFKTKFNFTEGFVKDTDGKNINFLIVAKPAVIAKAKFNSIYLFAPGEHTEGDGYLYQNRLYHDLFVLKTKQDGVYVSHKSA